MFFLIPFVSDTGKNHHSKHSSWWRRLGGDVLKTSWRRLQFNIFCLITCLENVLKTSCEVILKTSWRSLEDVSGRRIANTSWRRLEDVLEDEKCYAEDVLKTSWKTRNVCWDTTMQLNSFRYVLKVIIFFPAIVLDINHSSFSSSFGKDLKFWVAYIK